MKQLGVKVTHESWVALTNNLLFLSLCNKATHKSLQSTFDLNYVWQSKELTNGCLKESPIPTFTYSRRRLIWLRLLLSRLMLSFVYYYRINQIYKYRISIYYRQMCSVIVIIVCLKWSFMFRFSNKVHSSVYAKQPFVPTLNCLYLVWPKSFIPVCYLFRPRLFESERRIALNQQSSLIVVSMIFVGRSILMIQLRQRERWWK